MMQRYNSSPVRWVRQGQLQQKPIFKLVVDVLFENVQGAVETQVANQDWQQHGMLIQTYIM